MNSTISFVQVLFFIFSAIPGFYLAHKNNFIYITNQKYNLFILRLFVTLPVSFLFIIIFSIFSYFFISIIFPDQFDFYDLGNHYLILCLFSLFFSFLGIFFLEKYVLAKDMPEITWMDENKTPLYIYFPQYIIPSGFTLNFQTIYVERHNFKLPIHLPVGEISVDEKTIKNRNINIMKYGSQLIVDALTLEILKEKCISGFTSHPIRLHQIKNSKKNDLGYTNDYFYLNIKEEMPPSSLPTKLNYKKIPLRITLLDLKLYYNQKVLKNICDLNKTYEYFGNDFSTRPTPLVQYLIVTQKVKDIFIHRLGQNEWDFKTVYLTDDDGNIIKDYKKE